MITSTPVPGDDPEFIATLVGAELPIDDTHEPGRSFFRFEHGGRLLGFGGFELYDEDALLRSVVVPPETRGTGAGRAVVEGMLRLVAASGCKRAYLLTTSAAAFFEHLGFQQIDRASAPETILRTRQASSICSSAALLSRAV